MQLIVIILLPFTPMKRPKNKVFKDPINDKKINDKYIFKLIQIKWDSNPWYHKSTPVFKTGALSHSAIYLNKRG